MTITAEEVLGIPRSRPRPAGAVARVVLFLSLGTLAAALLFLLDSALVKREPRTQDKAVPVKLVEFVRVEGQDEVRIKERRLPPKPRPAEQPRPPEKLRVNQQANTQRMEIDFDMPAVEAGLGGGGGPWLGAYVPRQGGAGMHDGDILPIVRIEPQYPREALVRGIEGWVRVEFTIMEDGGVAEVDVVDARPRGVFERSAVNAVMRWKFKPRIENGAAVRRRGAQTIEFQLLEDDD